MTILIGNVAIAIALLFAAVTFVLSIASVRLDDRRLLVAARWVGGAYAALMLVASGALIAGLLSSEFRIEYVAHYTERALPFGYKLAAFWAGQEGSLLLWALMLGVMGTMLSVQQRKQFGAEAAGTLASFMAVCGFFAALMLFAANPFATSATVPADGNGLNPMLQDPGMIAHPPLLFLGYAGFTVPFAMLIGALIAGRRDNNWIAATRRWTIASWLFLGIGIILGAQWAYVELGWGGYWAWDPVENASLLPWLTSTALLHSIMIQQQRGMFKKWNAFLIAITFILCIFGTYLTRSGVIQSVHSFGESLVGTFFLAFLPVTTIFSASLLIACRDILAGEHKLEALMGREGIFLATTILLLGMTLIVLIGTIFPLISTLFTGGQVTVGQSFYNKVIAPLGMLLVALMSVGPLLAYGHDAAARLARGLVIPGILAVVVVAALFVAGLRNGWALACAAICAIAAGSILLDLVKSVIARVRNNGENPIAALLRLLDANHRRYGGQIVHVGVLMMIVGITASSLFSRTENLQFTPGQSRQFAGMNLKYETLDEVRFAHFTAIEAVLTATDADGNTMTLHPQKRFYDKAREANTEVSILWSLRQDVYLTLVGWEKGGTLVAIEAIVNPLVVWIWIGGIVMSLGGVICLLPRFAGETKPATAQIESPVSTPAPKKAKKSRGVRARPATA